MKRFLRDGFCLSGDGRKPVKSRGFTLTEIAIVLSIIGVVIAGIFGAAAIARYRVQLNQGVDEVGAIIVNVKALYSGQNYMAAPAIALPGAILVQQGVYPRDMLLPEPPSGTNPPAGTIANHPWDQGTAAGSAQIQVNNNGTFMLRFVKIPSDPCTDLLMKTSLSPTDTGLQKIQVGGVTVGQANNNSLPLTVTAAAAACPVGGTYTIDWTYSLGN